jgi:cell wall assembly regulator SMI1
LSPTNNALMDRWLAANRPDYYAQLQQGAEDRTLDLFEHRFELRLPREFRSLYKWRNGQRADCYACLLCNYMFSSLERITEAKGMLDGMIGKDFEEPEWWRRSWVPFLDNGNGDHLCLDLAAEDGGEPGQIIIFWHDWEDRSDKYASMEAWLAGLVRSMEEGTLKWSR